MKKIIVIFLFLIICFGCSNSVDVKYPYTIQSKNVDMSMYDGVTSTEHMFKSVTVQELFNTIDKKSSGVFYLGRDNCSCCQTCIQYLNEAAMDLGVTVYYINAYDEEMPVASDSETYNKLFEYLYDILDTVDGEKQLQTPTIFSVINGEIVDHLICLGDFAWDTPPTKLQTLRLVNKYKSILEPFSK